MIMQAWEMYKSDKLLHLLDSNITSTACNSANFSSDRDELDQERSDEDDVEQEEIEEEEDEEEEEAVRFLKVGLMCVQENSRLRPTVSAAIKMLTNEVNIDDVAVSRPGLINSFMDVKVGKTRSTSLQVSTSSMQSPQSHHFR